MTAFRIADTFTDSLARLTGEEQKAVKTTAFDLQLDPTAPGMSFHKLDKAKDRKFWSVRVSRDIRLIVHRIPGSLMLCYVDHHDKAYAWAERRKLEVHPTTGAAQLVELRERVEEITVPRYIHREEAPPPRAIAPPLFAHHSDETLLGYGVPAEWLGDVRAATEDSIFEVAEHLPREAAEALFDLAVGVTPAPASIETGPGADPFEHVDAQRRFRVITDVEELARAMDAPWDKWAVFLHPAQRDVAERRFNGPARVSGSAGTGKTVVALHRAVNLAKRDPDGRVLLATFSPTLANALRISLRRLIGSEPRLGERIEVSALDDVALRLYQRNIGKVKVATEANIMAIIDDAMSRADSGKFTAVFLGAEWSRVMDAWRLESWEAYRDVARLGRRTRLPEKQREQIWSVLVVVHTELKARGLMTMAGVYDALAVRMAKVRNPPFEYVVVDEAQDLSVPQLRFLAAVAGDRPDALFFSGDPGQRIFQAPFSWRQLGVDVRGRSSTLRVNYRTSHQIRSQADRLLDESVADVDGDDEPRHAVSVFNGPAPLVRTFDKEAEEIAGVAYYLRERIEEGVPPSEMAVFVRSEAQLDRARDAVDTARISSVLLGRDMETTHGSVVIAPMHLAKGLEFRVVVVMACDDEVIPLQERIEAATDPSELEEVYHSERHLLYVACTRARDHLMVSATRPESEFLRDLVAV
ncbi:MAG: 3'-5' exonuclease [Gemmatimonadaceae bacterium]